MQRITGEIAQDYLKRFPQVGALTLAKKIFLENPNIYTDLEHVRSTIRYYIGQKGKFNFKSIKSNPQFVRPSRAINPFEIPESEAELWMPFHIPERFNSGLIFSDNHFPYHDVQAHNSMLEYTVAHKKINFILVNGDALDCYQGSKYMKDLRKRSISNEIWMWIEFLHILYNTFPGVKIFWKLGNHEERLENYLKTQAPILLDMEEFKLGNIIKIREVEDVTVIEKQVIYAGRLPIVHSHEFANKSSSQVNPARGLFMKSLSSVMGAHSHVTSSHSETDINGKLMSTFSIGCLADLHPEYARLNRWNHGFAFIETEGLEFSVENMKIYKGKVYRA
jgi:hypothetical protein